jgi:hypothetical protein
MADSGILGGFLSLAALKELGDGELVRLLMRGHEATYPLFTNTALYVQDEFRSARGERYKTVAAKACT